MLHLAMCRPTVRPRRAPRPPAPANRHEVPDGPGGDGAGLRAGGHPASEDQPASVSTSFPVPVVLDSPSALALTILVAFTAVLFAYSYETCIIIIIIVTSMSCVPWWCCAPDWSWPLESLFPGRGSCQVPVLSVLFRAAGC